MAPRSHRRAKWAASPCASCPVSRAGLRPCRSHRRCSRLPSFRAASFAALRHRRRRRRLHSTRTRAPVAPVRLPVARQAHRRRPKRMRASALEKIHQAHWAGRQIGRWFGRLRRGTPSRRSCPTERSRLGRLTPAGPCYPRRTDARTFGTARLAAEPSRAQPTLRPAHPRPSPP